MARTNTQRRIRYVLLCLYACYGECFRYTLPLDQVQCPRPGAPRNLRRTTPYEATPQSSVKLYGAAIGGDMFGRAEGKPNGQTGPATAVKVVDVNTDAELRLATLICVEAFFGATSSLNPVRTLQMETLQDEQLADLRSRFRRQHNKMMIAVDSEGNAMGFVEVYVSGGMKYGLGPGVPERDQRPYLANLCVRPQCRRMGVAKMLIKRCEEVVKTWGYDEVVLEVDEKNVAARELYRQMGYVEVWRDPAGRKYDIGGLGIKSIRVTNVGMRKALGAANVFSEFFGRLVATS